MKATASELADCLQRLPDPKAHQGNPFIKMHVYDTLASFQATPPTYEGDGTVESRILEFELVKEEWVCQI